MPASNFEITGFQKWVLEHAKPNYLSVFINGNMQEMGIQVDIL